MVAQQHGRRRARAVVDHRDVLRAPRPVATLRQRHVDNGVLARAHVLGEPVQRGEQLAQVGAVPGRCVVPAGGPAREDRGMVKEVRRPWSYPLWNSRLGSASSYLLNRSRRRSSVRLLMCWMRRVVSTEALITIQRQDPVGV
jgi:hypothetical protein